MDQDTLSSMPEEDFKIMLADMAAVMMKRHDPVGCVLMITLGAEATGLLDPIHSAMHQLERILGIGEKIEQRKDTPGINNAKLN